MFICSYVCFSLLFVSFAKFDTKLQVGAPVGCTHKSLTGVVVAVGKSKITIKNALTNKNNKVLRKNVVVTPIAQNLIQHKRTKLWYKVLKPYKQGVVAAKIEVPVEEPPAVLPEQTAPSNPSAQTHADRANKKSKGAFASRLHTHSHLFLNAQICFFKHKFAFSHTNPQSLIPALPLQFAFAFSDTNLLCQTHICF